MPWKLHRAAIEHPNMKSNSTRTRNSTLSKLDYEFFGSKVILLIFKIMGLAPLSIFRNRPKQKGLKPISEALTTTKFAYSHIGSFYNVFLIICTFGVNFVTVPLLDSNEYPFKTDLTEMIELTQAIVGNATVLFIWLLMCLRQKTMVKIMNRLMSVDDTVCRSPESNRNYFILLYLTNTLVWIEVIVSNQQCYDSSVPSWMNDIVPGIIINWFMIQYVITVKLIETRFRALNRTLLDSSRSSIVVPIRSLIMGYGQTDNFDFPKILSFRRTHTELYGISGQVAEFYSIPVVFTIALSCYSLIYNAYYLVLPFVFETEEDTTLIILNSLSWLIGLMLPITMLALEINETTAQMKRTAHTVHKLLARSLITREEKSELKIFSLELLQREVEFTACGLFSLDCTLVHSIFSMLVTYLIILFQFQIAHHHVE